MPPTPRFYPPGLPRTNDLVRLYDLFYALESRMVATSNNSTNGSSTTNISISGGGTVVTPVSSEVVDVFNLAANNNVTVSVPSGLPAAYVAVLVQPASGNGGVIWGPGFFAAANALDPGNNTISVFRFSAVNLNGNIGYVMTGQPTTGMTL